VHSRNILPIASGNNKNEGANPEFLWFFALDEFTFCKIFAIRVISGCERLLDAVNEPPLRKAPIFGMKWETDRNLNDREDH
jgi:hypothetical protein